MLSVCSDMNLSIWESRCWKDKRGCGGRGWGPPPERGLCTPVPSTADQPRDPPNPRLRPQDRQLEMTNQRCTDDRPPSFYACKSRKIISPPLVVRVVAKMKWDWWRRCQLHTIQERPSSYGDNRGPLLGIFTTPSSFRLHNSTRASC